MQLNYQTNCLLAWQWTEKRDKELTDYSSGHTAYLPLTLGGHLIMHQVSHSLLVTEKRRPARCIRCVFSQRWFRFYSAPNYLKYRLFVGVKFVYRFMMFHLQHYKSQNTLIQNRSILVSRWMKWLVENTITPSPRLNTYTVLIYAESECKSPSASLCIWKENIHHATSIILGFHAQIQCVSCGGWWLCQDVTAEMFPAFDCELRPFHSWFQYCNFTPPVGCYQILLRVRRPWQNRVTDMKSSDWSLNAVRMMSQLLITV